MATAYSSEVSVGTYNRIRLRVEYSGTSARCYIEFRRTQSYTGTWADSNSSITFNNKTVSCPYSYTGTVGTSWVQLCNASGFTVSTSGGTYNWSFNNPTSGSVLGCSGTITIGSQATAPTGLTASNIVPRADGFTATISVTGWGNAGDSSTRYRELQCHTYDPSSLITPRRYQQSKGNSTSGNITVNNTSSGDLTIVPNTRYTLGMYASNGTYNTGSQRIGNYVTLGSPAVVEITDMTTDSVTLSYSVAADGGFYDKTISYSIDNGTTWTTLDTSIAGAAVDGTITLSNLTPGQPYTIITKVSSTAGDNTQTLRFATNPHERIIYGSVNDGAEVITKMYGSYNNQAQTINKFYVPTEEGPKLVHQDIGHLTYN